MCGRHKRAARILLECCLDCLLHCIILVRSFNNWAEGEPSGGLGCMGYSEEHGFMWDDIQCEDYFASGLTVGFICEGKIHF